MPSKMDKRERKTKGNLTKKAKVKNKMSKKKKIKKKKSKTSSRTSKRSNKKVEVKETVDRNDLPKYLRSVDKPISYAHIEYDLIPDRVKHKLDIVFWGSVVKVFCDDDAKIMTTIIIDNTAWVLVQIVHFVNTFNTEEIFKLHAHVLNIVVSTKKNQCGSNAIAENTKTFYLRNDEVDVDRIVEAFTEDPNLIEMDERRSLNLYVYDMIRDCYSRPCYNEEIVSLLKYDKIHYHHANKIIKNVSDGIRVKNLKRFAPICLPPTNEEDDGDDEYVQKKDSFVKVTIKKSKGKKVGKGKKGKKGTVEKKSKKSKKSTKSKNSLKSKKSSKTKKSKTVKVVLKFTIPGEVFVTNPRLSIFGLENTDSYLKNGFLLISVSNLFNSDQALNLNPLIVSIESLKNVPRNILTNHGFTDVYAEYNVPQIGRCKSLIKPLEDDDIVFNEAHAHFTDKLSRQRLIKFILTEPFFIKIIGIRNIDETNGNDLYGTGLNDDYLSEKLSYDKYVFKTKERRDKVILAAFGFDLRKLYKPYFFLNEHNNNNLPEMVYFGCDKQMKVRNINVESVNAYNITMHETTIECDYLLQDLLIEHSTILNAKIQFYSPTALIGRPLQFDVKYFKRLLIIFFDRLAFDNVYHIIRVHNQKCYNNEDDDNDILTGFVIDNHDSIITYVEGIGNGKIARLLYILTSFPNASVNLHFDTKLLFDKRLYERFINMHDGIFKINLVYPIRYILNNDNMYVIGNVPKGCFNAVLKLNMLHNGTSFIHMFKKNQFPSFEELISLNMEYGVPFYKKLIEDPKLIDSESIDYDSDEDIIFSCDMY